MRLQVPKAKKEGVLWLESECAGIVSEATPLVMTANPDIAEEIQSLGESETSQEMHEAAVSSLLVDIGMTLQYANHLSRRQPEEKSEAAGKICGSFRDMDLIKPPILYLYNSVLCFS